MRKWQVRFQIYRPMSSLPAPSEIVEEIQSSPSYRLEGARRHDSNCQFCITLSGEGVFKYGPDISRLPAGTAFVVRNNDPRASYYFPEDGRRPWVFLWFSFWGDASAGMIDDIAERYGHVMHVPVDHPAIRRIASWRKFTNSVRTINPMEGAALVIDTMREIVGHIEKSETESPQGEMTRNVQEYVLKNVSADISVIEMAKRLGVSREHLSRTFRRNLGMSLHDYVTAEKMKHACRLLLETRLSCKEIAGMAGYGNTISFNRAFKSTLRMTPSELRASGQMPDFNF